MNQGTGSDKQPKFDKQFAMLKKIGRNALWVSCLIALFAYFSTSVKQVKVQETGILLRFGKVIQKRVDPGICVKFPWPIDKLVTVKTRSIETMQTGFGADKNRVDEFERSYGPLDQLTNGTLTIPYIITGDKNVLHLKVLISYQISDPVTYTFSITDGSRMMGLFTQSTILDYVSAAHVDDLLTSGKLDLRDYINDNLNKQLEKVDLGLQVVSVEVRNVRPPGYTSQAFKDVINAQEESREMIHQAESYSRRIAPEAIAEAQQVVIEAEAYRTKVVEGATGEAQRFQLLAKEYALYPKVTRERLLRESLETIFPSVRKYIVGETARGQAANLRFIENGSTED